MVMTRLRVRLSDRLGIGHRVRFRMWIRVQLMGRHMVRVRLRLCNRFRLMVRLRVRTAMARLMPWLRLGVDHNIMLRVRVDQRVRLQAKPSDRLMVKLDLGLQLGLG